MIISTILLSALSAFLYRLGGLSKEQAKQQIPWCPSWLINSKTRDVGCSLIAVGWMLLFYPRMEWFVYLISFGLTWGALSTYHDYINGKDNFWLHGLGVALAFVPFSMDVDWILGLALRCLALAILMGAWCAIFKNDWIEELGRGAFIIATLLILLI